MGCGRTGVAPPAPQGRDVSDDRRTLDRTLVAGLSWNAAARWGGQLISWGSTLIVVRLLTPADYGIAAMAGVLFGLVNLVADGGLGTAIVSRRESEPGRLSQLHAVALLLGVAAASIVALLAWPLAWFFKEPRLVPLILVVSLMYLIVGFRVVPLATLQRDLAFKTLARNDLLWVSSGAVSSVVAAALGLGYWALIIGPLTGSAVATLAAWHTAPQRPARPRFGELAATIRFGGHLLVSRLAAHLNGIADSIVIGRRLGQEPLGSYRVAMEVASLPLEKVAAVLLQVATPVFASVREDRVALSRYLLLMTEALALVGWPLAIGLALVADPLVPVVLGEQWQPAVGPMRALALAGAIRCLMPLVHSIALARGHSLLIARVAFIGTPLFFGVLLLGSQWGVIGVAIAWAVGVPLLDAPILRHVLRELEVTLPRYLGVLLPAGAGIVAMALTVSAARWSLADRLSPALLLAVLVGVGGVTYVATVGLTSRGRLRQIWQGIRGQGTP